jgi:hypothetical protein
MKQYLTGNEERCSKSCKRGRKVAGILFYRMSTDNKTRRYFKINNVTRGTYYFNYFKSILPFSDNKKMSFLLKR